MSESVIQSVKNNEDKRNTYRYQLGRYQKARRYGFHFEAMLIVYSLLEDRLKSFLYYCGLFENRNTLKLSKRTREDILAIVYEDDVPVRIPSLNMITTKIEYVKKVVLWSNNINGSKIENNKYLLSLKSQTEYIDADALLTVLSELEVWLKYRNEIIHASMNKNLDKLYENIAFETEKAMDIARFIDSQVSIIKKKGSVRKDMKMQNN